MFSRLTKIQRLSILISITSSFFVAELSVGFHSRSLALVADAFHYMNDLVGFTVAVVALKASQSGKSPKGLSFGWQRAPLLGAFFNGVFLIAIGLSIFLQAIERMITIERVKEPQLVVIMGCIGFALNIVSAVCLHEPHEKSAAGSSDLECSRSPSVATEKSDPHEGHCHKRVSSTSEGRDLGMLGVLIHVVGDALNNIGVIIAGLVIWLAKYEGRYYADPATGIGIAILITLSALPLVRSSGLILLGSEPLGVNLDDMKSDLESIPGIVSVHELHAWRLTQNKAIASAHIVTSDQSLDKFLENAQLIKECLHAYGIHSHTLQPEFLKSDGENGQIQLNSVSESSVKTSICRLGCGRLCEEPVCCE